MFIILYINGALPNCLNGVHHMNVVKIDTKKKAAQASCVSTLSFPIEPIEKPI